MIGLLAATAAAAIVWLLLTLLCWHHQLTDWRRERSRARAESELRMRVEEHLWRAGLYRPRIDRRAEQIRRLQRRLAEEQT